jgi:hypothetical protein
MEELEKELKEGALTKDDLKSDGGDKAEKEEGLPSGFMLQLSTLRDQLVYLEEQGLHAEASSTSPSWTVETRKLITRLSDHSGRTADVESKEEVQEVLPVDAAALAGRGGDSSKFAALDNRLAGLEELIGVKDAMADEVSVGRHVTKKVGWNSCRFNLLFPFADQDSSEAAVTCSGPYRASPHTSHPSPPPGWHQSTNQGPSI